MIAKVLEWAGWTIVFSIAAGGSPWRFPSAALLDDPLQVLHQQRNVRILAPRNKLERGSSVGSERGLELSSSVNPNRHVRKLRRRRIKERTVGVLKSHSREVPVLGLGISTKGKITPVRLKFPFSQSLT